MKKRCLFISTAIFLMMNIDQDINIIGIRWSKETVLGWTTSLLMHSESLIWFIRITIIMSIL